MTLPAGVVTPGETITIISKDGAGNESQPATAVIPADVVLAAPTITKVEGNKANGYTVTGTADPNVTVQFTIAVNNYWQVAIQLLEAPSPFILQQG